MKKKLSFLLAFVVISTMSFAKIDPTLTVVAGSTKHIFKVIYKSNTTGKVRVTIFNSDNEKVFTETFDDVESVSRPYNFSNLPEGEYTIEVKDDSGRKVEKVTYGQGKVRSQISVVKLTSAPSKYMLTAINDGQSEITVSIIDEFGDVVYNETLSVSENFGVVYNLVEEGKYTFVIKDKSGATKTVSY